MWSGDNEEVAMMSWYIETNEREDDADVVDDDESEVDGEGAHEDDCNIVFRIYTMCFFLF